MKILLYPNFEKTDALECTCKAAEKLRALGSVPMLDIALREAAGDDIANYGTFASLLSACDVVMPIGGDGTVMRAARHAAAADKPVLGLNAGRLGFLTQLEMDELDNLALLTQGKYRLLKRMMLEAQLLQKGRKRRFCALNDVVVSRKEPDRIVDIEVRCGDALIAKHRADGIVFATPTGSTAYSLSAGGPIVDPDMELIIMSAICSHSTFSRSLVLPAENEYKVTDQSLHNKNGLAVSVDGRMVGNISGDEEVTVRKSKTCVTFIDLGIRNYYQNVNEKLSWGR